MFRILICAVVAAATTYATHVWLKRQTLASGRAYPRGDALRWLLHLLELVWAVLMTILIWAGFMDHVRSLSAYPFARLAASLAIGAGFVALGSIAVTMLRHVEIGSSRERLPLWRALSPTGCQMLFLLFSGAAFQHSGWGGPP